MPQHRGLSPAAARLRTSAGPLTALALAPPPPPALARTAPGRTARAAARSSTCLNTRSVRVLRQPSQAPRLHPVHVPRSCRCHPQRRAPCSLLNKPANERACFDVQLQVASQLVIWDSCSVPNLGGLERTFFQRTLIRGSARAFRAKRAAIFQALMSDAQGRRASTASPAALA